MRDSRENLRYRRAQFTGRHFLARISPYSLYKPGIPRSLNGRSDCLHAWSGAINAAITAKIQRTLVPKSLSRNGPLDSSTSVNRIPPSSFFPLSLPPPTRVGRCDPAGIADQFRSDQDLRHVPRGAQVARTWKPCTVSRGIDSPMISGLHGPVTSGSPPAHRKL